MNNSYSDPSVVESRDNTGKRRRRTGSDRIITDLGALQAQLQLDPASATPAASLLRQFPVRVPAAYLRKITRGDPSDPLLRQVMPSAAEQQQHAGFVQDPLGETQARPTPQLLHKYHGRALLITTSACAIHCRYCFRRHFPYTPASRLQQNWRQALDYLHNEPSIHELILSGGDPLTLSNRRLRTLLQALDGIKHLRRLRIHSRIPAVLPARIDAELNALLQNSRLQTVLVTHVNHARELDAEVGEASGRLRAGGTVLLNQSVLLRGVNDSAQSLVELSEALFAYSILPYYLHMPDAVAGTAHFHVGKHRARHLMKEVRTVLPGYLVPRLVREQAGAPYKIPLL